MSNPPQACEQCQSALGRKQYKYCSRACADLGHRKRYGVCLGCGIQLLRRKQFHCSMACRKAAPPPGPYDADIRRLREQGMTFAEVAAELGLTSDGVWRRAKKLKLPQGPAWRSPARFTPEQDAIISRLWPNGAHLSFLQTLVNALPGRPLETQKQLENAVHRLKLRRTQAAKSARLGQVSRAYWEVNRIHPPNHGPDRSHRPRVPGIGIPLREVYRWGADLGVPLSKRGDVAVVSLAMQRANPEHPGFYVTSMQSGGTSWGWA
jgi:hypothetical protein